MRAEQRYFGVAASVPFQILIGFAACVFRVCVISAIATGRNSWKNSRYGRFDVGGYARVKHRFRLTGSKTRRADDIRNAHEHKKVIEITTPYWRRA